MISPPQAHAIIAITSARGSPVKEALELWIRTQTQEEIAQEALHLLKQGYDLGKRKYRTRDDLYERRTGTC